MKRIILFFITVIVLANSDLSAQNLSTIPGSFVDIGFGGRPVGLGFAYVGAADDENSIFWNPAGLGSISQTTVGFSQADQMGLITYNHANAILPLPAMDHAVSLAFLSSGDDALKEVSIYASYGLKIKDFSVGATLKYRNASFGNNSFSRSDFQVFDDDEYETGIGQQVFGDANGFGMDLGFLYRPIETIKFGILVRDAFAPMNWNSKARSTEYQSRGSYNEKLPNELLFGTSIQFTEKILVVADYQPAMDEDRVHWVRAGIEGKLVNILFLRAGTEQGINDIDDDKITLGTGIDIVIKNKIRVKSDFAYVIDPIQNSQRISFTVSF
jgi:hypothetical protein